ncbi:predicted protein [Aspergillus terreus NIH2624]|uniref:Uncharacterized protein n=1 Tax=Aspergillus terreus (strain NIH 2624 / FGSC A1156) TaxID=341663 RepID=Q0CZ31_ASPTN|nr:uncharacterized protein ATEG_01053 [Aspergillus terreus NIH2624]EAU37810.1 predicted protein [Aspergillus terreus NIH2624]
MVTGRRSALHFGRALRSGDGERRGNRASLGERAEGGGLGDPESAARHGLVLAVVRTAVRASSVRRSRGVGGVHRGVGLGGFGTGRLSSGRRDGLGHGGSGAVDTRHGGGHAGSNGAGGGHLRDDRGRLGGLGGTLLVQLDGVDLPLWMGLLGSLSGQLESPKTPPAQSPQKVVSMMNFCDLKRSWKVAGALQVRHGGAKLGGVGLSTLDRRRDRGPGEEPDLDELGGPFHSIHTTALLVEGVARRALGALDDAADGAGGLAALARGEGAGHIVAAGDIAGTAGVQHNLVGLVLVDALDNIDLAVLRPAGTDGPERRPGAADAAGHVLDIKHVQAFVVEALGFDTDGLSPGAAGGQRRVGVYAHVDAAALGDVEQTGALGIALVGVGDEAIGRVGAVEEIKVIQEVLALPGLEQVIAGAGGRSDRRRDERRHGQRPNAPKKGRRGHLQ